VTLAQIARALADTARQRADLREADETLAAQEIQLRAMLQEAKRRLHSESRGSRLGSRMQHPSAAPREKRISIADSNTHNASEAKQLLLAAGASDSDVAKFCGVGRSTVQAWHAGRNPIPQKQAEAILGEWAVPLSAWPRIQ
jgi:DNA-binding transcriptional regulator YiaG